LVVGARAVAVSHGAQDDLLLAALALGAAAVSIANAAGRRRRTLREERADSNRVAGATSTRACKSPMIHLGY
ncbi:MAG: hypothetical protein LC672_02625, partial [Acidobacteria bacterium]|nr:hypothetical protein [Acidobacteriota bacterium]